MLQILRHTPILESAFIAGHKMTTAAAAAPPHYYFTTDWLDTNRLIGYSHTVLISSYKLRATNYTNNDPEGMYLLGLPPPRM